MVTNNRCKCCDWFTCYHYRICLKINKMEYYKTRITTLYVYDCENVLFQSLKKAFSRLIFIKNST